MKILFFILVLLSNFAHSQSIIGKWKTIDDKTQKELSIVEIYKKEGKYHGRLIEIINVLSSHADCKKCSAKIKNKSLIGKDVIVNLKLSESLFEGILIDPFSDKKYTCHVKVVTNNKIKVTVFAGFQLFSRTQHWVKL